MGKYRSACLMIPAAVAGGLEVAAARAMVGAELPNGYAATSTAVCCDAFRQWAIQGHHRF